MQEPIIKSLLATDLYKLTMWQALLHAWPANTARYEFVCRNTPAAPLSRLEGALEREIAALCDLRFTEEELAYLSGLPYLKADFIDFLRIFRFQRRYLHIQTDGDTLRVVAEGPQIHVMGFEIYLLSLINELHFREFITKAHLDEGRARLAAKIATVRETDPAGRQGERYPFEFFDFGLRRRASGAWHDEVVGTLAREIPEHFKGTSNVALARRHGLVPIGTMAHEYLQTFQAVGVQLRSSQRAALEAWVQEFRGDLGIALTDVIGMDAFLADFDRYFAKLFDGLRHDSGDPYAWGEKALAHYQALKVDARSKRLVWSDGLTLERALALWEHFSDRAMTGFGIGTNLTNDLGLEPLNIVMKLVRCNEQPVAKLSDSPGKTMCDDETFLAYLRQVFNHPEVATKD